MFGNFYAGNYVTYTLKLSCLIFMQLVEIKKKNYFHSWKVKFTLNTQSFDYGNLNLPCTLNISKNLEFIYVMYF